MRQPLCIKRKIGKEMKRVFLYGLYMDSEILKGLGCNPLDPEVVRLDGYGLRIGEKATLVKASNEFCLGQLITLEEEEVENSNNSR
jgi:hypothetical protein